MHLENAQEVFWNKFNNWTDGSVERIIPRKTNTYFLGLPEILWVTYFHLFYNVQYTALKHMIPPGPKFNKMNNVNEGWKISNYGTDNH